MSLPKVRPNVNLPFNFCIVKMEFCRFLCHSPTRFRYPNNTVFILKNAVKCVIGVTVLIIMSPVITVSLHCALEIGVNLAS